MNTATTTSTGRRRRLLSAGRLWLLGAVMAGSYVAVISLLDTFTNGGRGVEIFWPWTSERFFAPVRPIEVSPLGVRGFFSPRGIEVLQSEVIWVWAPALAAGLALLAARRR